jgi:hypothetical protein
MTIAPKLALLDTFSITFEIDWMMLWISDRLEEVYDEKTDDAGDVVNPALAYGVTNS